MQHPSFTLSLLVASAFGPGKNVCLFTPSRHTQCLFSFFLVRVANSHVAVRCIDQPVECAVFGADVPEIERFGGLAHVARLVLFKFNIKMRQAASYKSKYHPSLCFRLQFINRWHLCVPAAVLQKSHGPLLRRISLLVITFARGLFRLLHAGLQN